MSTCGKNDAGERGDIILGWLARIVFSIGLIGIVVFDGLSIGVAHISAIDDADTAALSASRAYRDTHDLGAALRAAQETASEHGEKVVPDSLSIDSDGTAHLAIEHDATTLIVRHIQLLRSWAVVVEDGAGRSLSS